MEQLGSPLYPLLNEIMQAAHGGLPFLAIAMTVALPDICVSLISDDGRSDKDRYKEWCRENLVTGFDLVTPDDLYSMRCGVLHNGRFGDLKHSVARVIFLPKSPQKNQFSDCQFGDAYFYSVETFCSNVCNAIHQWFEVNRNHPNILKNIDRLMQYRNGFMPYILGTTVLA